MTTVIVSGALANKPFNGGNAWVILSWIRGFERLGFNVYFLEQIDTRNCVNGTGDATVFAHSANLAYFKRITDEFGLDKSAALICDDGEQIFGLSYPGLLEAARSADLLINITGHLTLESIKQRVRRRLYLDLDPAFTQFWHASGDRAGHLEGHSHYFTIGENIGTSACSIPVGDIPWRKVHQPVVLQDWPVTATNIPDRFTTVASWRGPYGLVTYGGKTFGMKVHEFRKFIELPERAPQAFELALEIHPEDHKDLQALVDHRWQTADPRIVASDPAAFRSYVQNSGAEFSAAQGAYVDTESGWFSDRTVRYLASGKPALVQDTGLSKNYPVGEGLLSFRTLDEAVEGAETIAADYDRHSRAARELAEEYFDSDKVLGQLLDEVDLAP